MIDNSFLKNYRGHALINKKFLERNHLPAVFLKKIAIIVINIVFFIIIKKIIKSILNFIYIFI